MDRRDGEGEEEGRAVDISTVLKSWVRAQLLLPKVMMTGRRGMSYEKREQLKHLTKHLPPSHVCIHSHTPHTTYACSLSRNRVIHSRSCLYAEDLVCPPKTVIYDFMSIFYF